MVAFPVVKRLSTLTVFFFSGLLLSCQTDRPDCEQLPQLSMKGNAGCLAVNPNGELLMVKQRVSGAWAMPGGTAEPGERAVCTALRETLEETGYGVEATQLLGVMPNGFHVFACQLMPDQTVGVADNIEISAVDWLDKNERDHVKWRFEAQKNQINAWVESSEPVGRP